MRFCKRQRNTAMRKMKMTTKRNVTPAITYEVSMGVIRMIDTSVVANSSASVSPIKLSESMRENIKKPVLAKNV